MTRAATLYVVDDDPAVLGSFRKLAEVTGLRVETFGSGKEFLAACHDPFGCLLLDVRMPGIDGFEVLRRIRSMGIEIPAIVISGHADDLMSVKATKDGVIHFLEKPCNPEELVSLINQNIEIDRQRRAGAKPFVEMKGVPKGYRVA